jgi:hypothetical protein
MLGCTFGAQCRPTLVEHCLTYHQSTLSFYARLHLWGALLPDRIIQSELIARLHLQGPLLPDRISQSELIAQLHLQDPLLPDRISQSELIARLHLSGIIPFFSIVLCVSESEATTLGCIFGYHPCFEHRLAARHHCNQCIYNGSKTNTTGNLPVGR